MKRSWFGAGLLVLLLILSLLSGSLLARCHQPVARDLEAAAEASLAGDDAQAALLTHRARDRWDHYRSLSAAVIDHTPLEEADALFVQLQISLGRDEPQTAALCRELAGKVDALIQSYRCHWWNLL